MSAPPYQKWFWGSYHKHTAHLRHAREHGAFMLLIGALWNNDGRLPADDDVLAGHALLTPKEWAAVKPRLMPLFKIVRGKLTQRRVTEDLAKYRDTSGKRKEAGKAGGKASAGKTKGNRTANAGVLPTKSESESEPKKEDRLADANLLFELTPEREVLKGKAAFAAFWKAYPLKVGKGAAEKAFDRAMRIIGGVDPLAVLLLALDRIAPTWASMDRDRLPHASTWLNQRRWEDEPPENVVALPLSAPPPPRQSLSDQIGEENDRARAQAFAILEKRNG